MSIPMRKALPLFLLLCLCFCLCLMPAAHAGDEGDPPEDLMGEFLQAVENEDDTFNITGRGDFTLTDSIEIPTGMQFIADAVIVPADTTLTLLGKLQADVITVAEGGAVVVSGGRLEAENAFDLAGSLSLNDAWIRIGGPIWAAWATTGADGQIEYVGDSGIQVWLNVNNLSELGRALDAAGNYHQLNEHFMLFVHTNFFIPVGQDVTIPSYVALHMHGDWFVVEENATLTIEEGAFVDFSGGNAAIHGSVVNNGTLHIYKDENGSSWMNFHDGSSYEGSGILSLESRVDNPLGLVGGSLNVSELVPVEFSETKIKLQIPESASAALAAVCENEYPDRYYYRFPGEGEVTLTDELIIPENLTVDARGVSFVLDEGAALTVSNDAQLLTGSFAYHHGTVTVNGFLYAQDSFTVGNGLTEGDSFTLNGTLSIENDAVGQLDAIKNVEGSVITYGESGVLDLSYNAYDETDLLAVLGAEEDTTANFRRSAWVLFPWAMENAEFDANDSFTLPAQLRLCLSNDGGEQDGSLVIPEGKTLVIPESGELVARGAVGDGRSAIIQVDGSLVNAGRIHLDWYGSSLADVSLGANGSFTNNNDDENAVTRGGEPYTILSEPEGAAILALRAAIRDSENLGDEYDFKNKGDLTLTRDLTIPSGVLVRAAGTNLTVAEGVTLTVRGGFNFTDLIVDGSVRFERDGKSQIYGDLTINENGVVDVTEDSRLEVLQNNGVLSLSHAGALNFKDNSDGQITLLSEDDLANSIGIHNQKGVDLLFNVRSEGDNCDALVRDAKTCMEGLADTYGDRASYAVIVGSPWTLTGDLRFENVGLCAFSPVTVPQNTTLEVGYLEMRGAELSLAGTLINHYKVRLFEKVVNQQIVGIGALSAAEGGRYKGRGILEVTAVADDPFTQTNIPGLVLQERNSEEDNWVLTNNGDLYQEILDYLDGNQDAIAAGKGFFDISDQGDFILPGDLRLPAGFYLETANTRIIVPGPAEEGAEGVTLTIGAGNWTDMETLEIQEGGSLVLEPNANFSVYNYINNGTVTVGEAATEESEGGGAQLHISVYEVGAELGDGGVETPFDRDTAVWYHYMPEDAEEFYSMVDEADTLEYPYNGNIQLNFDLVLEGTEDEPALLTLNAREDNSTSLDVNSSGRLTVGSNATLTLDSWLNVRSTTLTLRDGGMLVNNGDVYLCADEGRQIGTITAEDGGAYEGPGRIVVQNLSEHDNPDDHVLGIEGLVCVSNDGWEAVYRSPADVWEAFKAAADEALNDPDNGYYYNLRGLGRFPIREDTVIPANLSLDTGWTTIIVPGPGEGEDEGVTLTIASRAEKGFDALIIEEGGTVVLEPHASLSVYERFDTAGQVILGGREDGANLDIPVYGLNQIPYDSITIPNYDQEEPNASVWVRYYPETAADLPATIEEANDLGWPYMGNIQINFPWELSDELSTVANLNLNTDEEGSGGLTILAGGKLTLDTWTNVNASSITVNADAELINNNDIYVNADGKADAGVITIDEGGAYSGSGRIIVFGLPEGDDPDSHVVGFNDLIRLDGDNGEAIYLSNGGVLSGLRQAIEDGKDYYDLQNLGGIVLDGDLVIPDYMSVDAWGTAITVPAGMTLTVNGRLNCGNTIDLQLDATGDEQVYAALVIGENGYVNADNLGDGENPHVTIYRDGCLQLNNCDDPQTWLDSGNLSFPDGSGSVLVNHYADNADEFAWMLADCLTLPHYFNGELRVNGDITITPEVLEQIYVTLGSGQLADAVVQNMDTLLIEGGKVSLIVNGDWSDGFTPATLTVDSDVTLQCSHFQLWGGTLSIEGGFVNTDRVEIRVDDDRLGSLSLAQGGSYSGTGLVEVYDTDDPDTADACLLGFADGAFARFRTDGRFVYVSDEGAEAVFNELAEAVEYANAHPEEDAWCDLNNRGLLRITSDITLPANLHLDAWGTEIVVPQGKTMTVKGNINTNELTVHGVFTLADWGFIYAGSVTGDGTINVIGENELHTDYGAFRENLENDLISWDNFEFGDYNQVILIDNLYEPMLFEQAVERLQTELPEHFTGRINIDCALSLAPHEDQQEDGTVFDLVNPKPVRLEINNDASLSIEDGATLNADCISVNSAFLSVNSGGTLISNNWIVLASNWDDNGQMDPGVLSFEEGSHYVNNIHGYIHVRDTDEPDAQIWGFEHIVGDDYDRVTRFEQDDGTFYVLDAGSFFAQFRDACAVAAADINPEHSYTFDLTKLGLFSIPENLTIPSNMTVDATDTTLDIPNPAVLTVQGKLILTSWSFYGRGDAVVVPENGELNIASSDLVLAASVWEGWRNNGSDQRITFADGAWLYLGGPGFDSGEALVTALANVPEYLSDNVRYSIGAKEGLDYIEEVTVPAHVFLQVVGAENGRFLTVGDLTVQEGGGVIINSNAVLDVKKTLTLGGTIEMKDGSELFLNGDNEELVDSENILRSDSSHIVVHYYPESADDIGDMFARAEALPDYAHGNIHIGFDYVIDQDIESVKTDFHFSGGSFTLQSGHSLRADNIYLERCSLTVENGGTLDAGWLTDNGSSDVRFEAGSTVSVSESFYLQGSLWISSDEVLANLNVLNLGDFTRTPYGGGVLYTNDTPFYALRLACLIAAEDASGDNHEYATAGVDNLFLEDNLTIPANLSVNAAGTRIIFHDGKTLTVEGKLTITACDQLQVGGLVIPAGGNVEIADRVDLLATVWHSWIEDGSINGITFVENGCVKLAAIVGNDEEMMAASRLALHESIAGNQNVDMNFYVLYASTMPGNYGIPAGGTIYVFDTLTVPENTTLTVKGSLKAMTDAKIIVNGVLVNNGFVELSERDKAAGALLVVNGKYTGTGTIGVLHPGDTTGYIEGVNMSFFNADSRDNGTLFQFSPNTIPKMQLPAALKIIGDEAFANGAFVFVVVPDQTATIGAKAFADCTDLTYIVIPAATTSIDDSAFENVTGLTVFGSTEYVENYANAHHFNYITVRN